MTLTPGFDTSRLVDTANLWRAAPARVAHAMALVRRRAALVDLEARFGLDRRPGLALIRGPRGVGKSTMLLQIAAGRLGAGMPPDWILHLPLGVPVLAEAGLETLVRDAWGTANVGGARRTLLIDDVQGAPHGAAAANGDWPAQLARLAARYAPLTIIATTSLAPPPETLTEFSVFDVGPLSFTEYLRLSGRETKLVDPLSTRVGLLALNRAFLDYLNMGGLPGGGLVPGTGPGPRARAALDIVDDGSPHGAGIHDTRDLQRTFAYLVGHMGDELSYEPIAKDLGVAKNTLRKYLDYFERAGLAYRLNRVDLYGKRMERATRFKVYPSSPGFYTALFGGVGPRDPALGRLAETALINHIAPGPPGSLDDRLAYASWGARPAGPAGPVGQEGADDAPATGGVAFVGLSGEPARATDARALVWTAGGPPPAGSLGALTAFAQANRLDTALVFDTASLADETIGGVALTTRPVAWACYLTSYYFDPAGIAHNGPYGLKVVI